ncbi:MAG: tRNA(Met) cytidine acetyltransferase [Endozoicomonadaceae bacterium]|nr:tRNA(Met) cytidine acetyltransferase [Endozoicomonadaceae bacterium]
MQPISTISLKKRSIWVISGSMDWCFSLAKSWFPPSEDICWSHQQKNPFLLLGSECTVLVFNTFFNFNIDLLGLLSGTVVGGGYLVLLTPPLSMWPYYPDQDTARLLDQFPLPYPSRFIKRLIIILLKNKSIQWVNPESLTNISPPKLQRRSQDDTQQFKDDRHIDPMTANQCHIVEAIHALFWSKKPNKLILTALRGRGKTAALGFAAANILKCSHQKPIQIIITAPYQKALNTFYITLFHCLKQARIDYSYHKQKSILVIQEHQIIFLPPDQVLKSTADLLFVDEAAAIPIPVLNQMSQQFMCAVFSSTLDGYEGTGKGFDLKFKAQGLQAGWQHCTLYEPMRWARDDPVEQLIYRILGTQWPSLLCKKIKTKSFQVKRISQYELLKNNVLLDQMFALLALAHYQTKPSYLRQLMDANNMIIHVIQSYDEQIIGVCVSVIEEPIAIINQADVLLGKRRLKNHLLSQLLGTQCHVPEALNARALRVQRIVIHPSYQRQKLGSMFIQQVMQAGYDAHVDYIGTSFGVHADLMLFWKEQYFSLVGIGIKQDTSTGCHSAIFLKSTSKIGEHIFCKASTFFYQQIAYAFIDYLNTLDLQLSQMICCCISPSEPKRLTDIEIDLISCYTNGYRFFEYVHSVLSKFFWNQVSYIMNHHILSNIEKNIILLKIVQHKSWSCCVHILALSGKKEAKYLLRASFKKLMHQ